MNQVIAWLVAGDIAKVIEFTGGVRMSREEIRKAILNYGRTLCAPPENAFTLMDVIEVKNARVPQYSIRMPLWTEQEGRSDLTLELTVRIANEKTEVELDDIHVL